MKINSPHFWKDRRDPETGKYYNPDILTLHITVGSFYSTKYWFENPYSYVSSHWIVRKDGVWVQCVDEKDAAWTNGRIYRPSGNFLRRGKPLDVNPNFYSITVEAENSGEVPPWKQWISWARGCNEILNRHQLSINTDVINHFEIAGYKTCPKPYFTRFWLKRLIPFT